jgi:hypothetical protein
MNLRCVKCDLLSPNIPNWRALAGLEDAVKRPKYKRLQELSDGDPGRNRTRDLQHVRSYVHAAYNWGLKSEHDYRSASQRRFRLVYNPAAGIPTEPKNVGTHWLDEDEFVRGRESRQIRRHFGAPQEIS